MRANNLSAKAVPFELCQQVFELICPRENKRQFPGLSETGGVRIAFNLDRHGITFGASGGQLDPEFRILLIAGRR